MEQNQTQHSSSDLLGFVPQTPLPITEGTSLRVQHFAYAGEPVHRKCFTATEWLPNLQLILILGLKTRPTPYPLHPVHTPPALAEAEQGDSWFTQKQHCC